MADKKPGFTPRAHGDHVWGHYRSAIGHYIIESVDKLGTSEATTRYNVIQMDHHPGEPPRVKHYGSDLHDGWNGWTPAGGKSKAS